MQHERDTYCPSMCNCLDKSFCVVSLWPKLTQPRLLIDSNHRLRLLTATRGPYRFVKPEDKAVIFQYPEEKVAYLLQSNVVDEPIRREAGGASLSLINIASHDFISRQ